MGVPLLPDELDGDELIVEVAWGADPSAPDTSGWTWSDITEDVRFSSPIAVTLGRADEASTAQPAKCSMTLDNNAARYALGPKSPNYPYVRRNVPVRVRVAGQAGAALSLPGTEGAYAQTDTGSALDVADDLDVRVDVDPSTWRPETFAVLAARYDPFGERSWALRLLADGQLELAWSEDGETRRVAVSSTPVPDGAGRLSVRAVLDVDNAGDHTVTFYTASTFGGSWSELGTASSSGTTSIHNSDAPASVGALAGGAREFDNEGFIAGSVYAVQVLDGVDGTPVVDVDFATVDPNQHEFTDDAGVAWTLHGGATLVGGVLFFGYATGWRPSWNTRGNDSTVELTASGALRRLKQRSKPIRSSLFRDLSTKDDVVAYWPLEDGGRSGLFVSGRSNDESTLAPTSDDVDFAAFDEFPGSAAIPTCAEGAIVGPVPRYDGAANQRIIVLVAIPEDGMNEDDDRLVFRVWTTPGSGKVVRWDVYATPTGSMYVAGYDENGVELLSRDPLAFGVNGTLSMLSLWFEQKGPDTEVQLAMAEVGADSVGTDGGSTVATTYGRITQVQFGDKRGSNGTAYGHAAVVNDNVHATFWDTVRSSLVGWAGETATARIRRLCSEHGQPITITGTSDVPMGPQGQETFLDLLRECETADMGVLYDGIGPGLSYVARSERENVDPSVTVDVAAAELATSFEPADDDQRTVNEATATQVDGSSVTVTDVDGPLGTATIDVYDEETEINVDAAGMLRDYATWRVHLGTVEGYRYPSVAANMRATPQHARGWLAAGPSSRVDLLNPDAVFPQLPNDTIRLLVEGTEVDISPYEWHVTAKCSPFDPWRVITLADEQYHGAGEYVAHLDTVASSLRTDVDEGATSLDVVTNAGPRWTEKSEAFPFDIAVAGARVRVEDVAPAAADDFERTETDGWGDADTGQAWDTTLTGDPGDYAVTEPSETTPPEIVSSSVVTADAAATSVTAAGPPQVAAGDLLVAVGGIDTDGPDGGAGFTGPPGWDLLYENLESANALYGKVWGRLATEDDEADGTGVDYTWGFETNSSGVVVIMSIRHYSNSTVPPAWHIRETPEPATNDDDAQDAPSITPGDEALVINMWGGQTADDTSTYALPSSVDEVEQANGGGWVQLAVGAHVHAGSGDTGTMPATVAGRSFPYTSLSLAISPEAGDRAGGAMTLPATGEVHWAQLGDLVVDDFDVTVEASIDQEITGDNGAAVILSARFDYVADTLYFAWLLFNADGTVATSIGQHDDAPGEVFKTSSRTLSNAGTPRFRLRFAGSGTNLRAKLWYADEPEPDSWHVAVTHTAHTHGAIALGAERGDGNTNADLVAYFHEFTVNNPQTFTVEPTGSQFSGGDPVEIHSPPVLRM